ncbi:hypothetical protein HUN08_13605 [Gordonia sp. X0973]|uniref:hypothetical protein n=1 Tax=Gordonia sp. X0973 TaxID=2742602 RepID=UPI000F51CD4F|nr:hypothetical protein [Gordonia sp. X0973]QKT08106.1 hypothetical protein HUN08_13605 [Gordonia sp. X0973]
MGDEPVEILRRWADSGGIWRVLGSSGPALVIGLLRCDGGEEIDRIVSAQPALLDFVGGRRSSDDGD